MVKFSFQDPACCSTEHLEDTEAADIKESRRIKALWLRRSSLLLRFEAYCLAQIPQPAVLWQAVCGGEGSGLSSSQRSEEARPHLLKVSSSRIRDEALIQPQLPTGGLLSEIIADILFLLYRSCWLASSLVAAFVFITAPTGRVEDH